MGTTKIKKGDVVYHDFVFDSLVRDITRWYENYYIWHDRYLRLSIHLSVLLQEYDRKRFNNLKTLNKERDVFLEELQIKTEEIRSVYT